MNKEQILERISTDSGNVTTWVDPEKLAELLADFKVHMMTMPCDNEKCSCHTL